MNHIESEFKNNTQTWEILINILKKSERALPTTSLQLLTGKPQIKIDQVLETLQKHGIVRKVTQKKVSYWKAIGYG